MTANWGNNEGCQIMVFEPTFEEFKDFSGYIKFMESKGAHKAGVAKIIPPKEWHAVRRYNMKKIGEMEIKTPILQTVSGQQGLFQLINIQKKTMLVKDYKELANSPNYRPPEGTIDELERKFWKNITFNPAMYGADVPGSIYDKDVKYWNINSLNTILDTLNSHCKVKILGVNTAYLYFGMWKTTFPWHTEDMDLYSINYLHHGASKFWYSIPPEHGKRLETLAKGFFSGSAQDCAEFMRHKMTMISPQILRKFSIPVNKIVQNEGEFMVTFPYGYHSGFNLGFNIAESTNFASQRWIEFGKKAKHCQCDRDAVKINMDIFIKKFQPEEWKKEKEKKRRERENKRKKNGHQTDSDSSTEEEKETSDEDEEDDDEVNEEDGDEVEEEIEDTEEEISCPSDEESSTSVVTEKKVKTKVAHKRNRNVPVKKQRISLRQKFKQQNKTEQQAPNVIKKEKANEEAFSKQPIKNGDRPIQRRLDLSHIWKFSKTNDIAEYSYNKILSETETKCSVCVFFSSRDAELLRTGTYVQQPNKRHSLAELKCGKLLVTELCFAMENSEEDAIESAYNLMFHSQIEQQEVNLLFCAKCHVAVHNVCYGVNLSPNNNNYNNNNNFKWYCQKCEYLLQRPPKDEGEEIDILLNGQDEDEKDISCCLCMLRGGALKRTTSGQWCHIVCAIAIPEVFFEDIQLRERINVENLNPARKKLHCIYCSDLVKPYSSEAVMESSCVQCQCGKCASPFHVTCSFHHGIPLYLGDWPLLIETLCPKHCRSKNLKQEKRELVSIINGDVVYAKHKNGRYYKGRVISYNTVLYYKVVFMDKSFCFDLPPEDIQDVDAKNHIVADGEMVQVLWTDSLTYQAEITGHWFETVCQVHFEDGSILNVKRGDLYLDGEAIPKRIKSKISYASETANKGFFPESLLNGSNRPRAGVHKCNSVHKKL